LLFDYVTFVTRLRCSVVLILVVVVTLRALLLIVRYVRYGRCCALRCCCYVATLLRYGCLRLICCCCPVTLFPAFVRYVDYVVPLRSFLRLYVYVVTTLPAPHVISIYVYVYVTTVCFVVAFVVRLFCFTFVTLLRLFRCCTLLPLLRLRCVSLRYPVYDSHLRAVVRYLRYVWLRCYVDLLLRLRLRWLFPVFVALLITF